MKQILSIWNSKFFTKSRLFNRTTSRDEIKSYEALMMMGDLDELYNKMDYELKLNQLSALTEGATQKARKAEDSVIEMENL